MSEDHLFGQHDDGCTNYLERIVYFLDNELDDADCSAVREHLDECGPAWPSTTCRRP